MQRRQVLKRVQFHTKQHPEIRI